MILHYEIAETLDCILIGDKLRIVSKIIMDNN